MAELKICRICLRTEAKVYKIDCFQLKSYYEEVMALMVNDDDRLPHYFCYECATMLHKFHKFKEKCYRGQKALRELSWRGPITYESVYKIDRQANNLASDLEIVIITDKVKAYTIKVKTESTHAENDSSQLVKIEDIENNSSTDEDDNANSEEDLITVNNEPSSPKTIIIDSEKEVVELKSEEIRERKKVKHKFERNIFNSISKRTIRFLDAANWKKYTLTEEEAVREFRAKTDDPKYVKAAYRCTDCFRGFSKDEMLRRHVTLRHSERLGVFECRFCHMRFKWDSHMRIHMRQHFTKYECLRCHYVCTLENSARLHEEYHTGKIKKCIHCDEKFRHISTYYTHLRTSHRSEFVCTMCGVSFVSDAGLRHHKKIKHITDDIESPDDDEDVNTYCEKCDIRFETRKAYEEHLFHSIMHAEGMEHELKDEITIPRKVIGKRLKAKIKKALNKRKQHEDPFDGLKMKKSRKYRRQHRKPTTCHQCGKHFDTQAACMKHHIAEHPRTSFYPPTERHICELCGASLAPGSVAAHQNMHSREVVHSCETCGRQFHSSVGLKRHRVTHTGEKPYACSLCEKRFTQSNSMKLHYRTFHLKQPYPKRDRKRKKKELSQTTVEESESEAESSDNSLPEPEMDSPKQDHRLEPVSEPIPDALAQDETVHYLTLT